MIKDFGVKRTFDSNKLIQNAEIHFTFFNDYLTVKNDTGESKIPYDKLHRIIETKTNFYVMLAKNQGFILIKKEMSEELIDFIQKLISSIKKAS